jgi:hypothetical protein
VLQIGLEEFLLLQIAAVHVGLKLLHRPLGAQFRRRDGWGSRGVCHQRPHQQQGR